MQRATSPRTFMLRFWACFVVSLFFYHTNSIGNVVQSLLSIVYSFVRWVNNYYLTRGEEKEEKYGECFHILFGNGTKTIHFSFVVSRISSTSVLIEKIFFICFLVHIFYLVVFWRARAWQKVVRASSCSAYLSCKYISHVFLLGYATKSGTLGNSGSILPSCSSITRMFSFTWSWSILSSIGRANFHFSSRHQFSAL